MDNYKELQLKIRNARAEYIYKERLIVDKKTLKRKTFEEIGKKIGMTKQQAFETLDSYFQETKEED